jgi:hypothetical protein
MISMIARDLSLIGPADEAPEVARDLVRRKKWAVMLLYSVTITMEFAVWLGGSLGLVVLIAPARREVAFVVFALLLGVLVRQMGAAVRARFLGRMLRTPPSK